MNKKIVNRRSIIRVDRTSFSDENVYSLLHPEFKFTGPSEFDVARLEKKLHPLQVDSGEYSEYAIKSYQEAVELYRSVGRLSALRVTPWFYERKSLSGYDILEYLEKNNLLADCIDIYDLLAIEDRGEKFFERYFPEETIFAWKSACKNGGDRFKDRPCVPRLSLREGVREGGFLNLEWHELMYSNYEPNDYILCHEKK